MSKQRFEPADFLTQVAERLVLEFAHAGEAGTPGLIGGAREHPARTQFERLLPAAAGVGTGIVMDGERKVSRQQDIVIYERSQAPVFSINDTAEATYFPVEGVAAVGEVKSTLGLDELRDAFEKVSSVKRLRRQSEPEGGRSGAARAFRSYGENNSLIGTTTEDFDQDLKPLDQVFGFILCNRLGASSRTMLSHARELWIHTPAALAPNLLVSLHDGFISPSRGTELQFSRHDADSAAICTVPAAGFPLLIERLHRMIRHGRTVPSEAYDRYFRPPSTQAQQWPITRLAFDQAEGTIA